MDHLYWLSVGKIVWIDILLSGDNAIVIALACRALPARQRLYAMLLGTFAAVALRVSLTGAASYLMELSYLKLCGGAALAFVAVKLLVPEENDGDERDAPERLLKAIVTIVIADITMSIDNVIAVAAASYGDVTLLAIGLLVSIPIVIGGAAVISKFLDRFPILIWAGSALLGWIAGEVMASDPVVLRWLSPPFDFMPLWGFFGAVLVLLVGGMWRAGSIPITKTEEH